MKKIIKLYTLVIGSFLVLASCEYDESQWDALHNNAPDPNAAFYFQFKDASKSLETGLAPNGDITEIETSIIVALLGLPRTESTTVTLSVDPASTIEANMYTLGTTSLVIPAGKASATTTFVSISENLPVGETVTLILNLDAGENTATNGTKLVYEILRPAPCAPVPGIYTIEMVDSYGDGWQTNGANGGNGITVDVDGVIFEVGMCSPYEASPYDNCTSWPAGADPANDLSFTSATATIEIPSGAMLAKWSFPGDEYGEIGFTIIDPNGNVAYKVNVGEGVAGPLPFEVCLD